MRHRRSCNQYLYSLLVGSFDLCTSFVFLMTSTLEMQKEKGFLETSTAGFNSIQRRVSSDSFEALTTDLILRSSIRE